jgi:AcrR family transcriptional regulator
MPRTSGEARRAEILAASGRLVRQRGFTTTRLSDVAGQLGLSAPLIVYHFGTKDELMAATLAAEVSAELARMDRIVSSAAGPKVKVERILRMSLGPASVADWRLWIDAWGEGLRSPVMRRLLVELDERWQQAILTVVTEGRAAGIFMVDDPDVSAPRILALLDGYGIQLVRAGSARARRRVLAAARRAVAAELDRV